MTLPLGPGSMQQIAEVSLQGEPRGVTPSSPAAASIGGELAGPHPANGILLSRVNGVANAPKDASLDHLDALYRERSGYVAEVDWRHHR